MEQGESVVRGESLGDRRNLDRMSRSHQVQPRVLWCLCFLTLLVKFSWFDNFCEVFWQSKLTERERGGESVRMCCVTNISRHVENRSSRAGRAPLPSPRPVVSRRGLSYPLPDRLGKREKGQWTCAHLTARIDRMDWNGTGEEHTRVMITGVVSRLTDMDRQPEGNATREKKRIGGSTGGSHVKVQLRSCAEKTAKWY